MVVNSRSLFTTCGAPRTTLTPSSRLFGSRTTRVAVPSARSSVQVSQTMSCRKSFWLLQSTVSWVGRSRPVSPQLLKVGSSSAAASRVSVAVASLASTTLVAAVAEAPAPLREPASWLVAVSIFCQTGSRSAGCSRRGREQRWQLRQPELCGKRLQSQDDPSLSKKNG